MGSKRPICTYALFLNSARCVLEAACPRPAPFVTRAEGKEVTLKVTSNPTCTPIRTSSEYHEFVIHVLTSLSQYVQVIDVLFYHYSWKAGSTKGSRNKRRVDEHLNTSWQRRSGWPKKEVEVRIYWNFGGSTRVRMITLKEVERPYLMYSHFCRRTSNASTS